MKLVSLAIAALLIAACTPVAESASQAIRDEFDDATASNNWFSCKRRENIFAFGKLADENRTAATATVNSLPQSNAFDLVWNHGGCADKDGRYDPDGFERAELWEADKIRAPIGTDIWYRFDMYIDDSITASTGRFVIGQWKQSNSPKDAPLLAQRFNGRAFTVSMEQDNVAPDHDPKDGLCRVFIASQASSPKRPGTGDPHDELIAPAFLKAMRTETLSIGHDLGGVAHQESPASPADLTGCAAGLKVTRFNSLPDPFGKWTTMVYHLRLVSDETGLIEIWANGKKISRTEGVIGFRPFLAKGRQYFKFGPYRNPTTFSTVTRLDHFVRSESRADVDPDGTLAPE